MVANIASGAAIKQPAKAVPMVRSLFAISFTVAVADTACTKKYFRAIGL